jgi:hypothetical protein
LQNIPRFFFYEDDVISLRVVLSYVHRHLWRVSIPCLWDNLRLPFYFPCRNRRFVQNSLNSE